MSKSTQTSSAKKSFPDVSKYTFDASNYTVITSSVKRDDKTGRLISVLQKPAKAKK